MFADLLKLLTGDEQREDPLAADDCRLALAALMVRVARADDVFDPRERDVISRILTDRYEMDAPAVQALIAEAEALERDAPDTVRFTRAIKDHVPYEERDAIAVSLWRVVLADEERTADENAAMRMVVNLLGINDRDSGLARQKAERSS
ncbi:MAG: TerB family tellurite resistance protein [Pseudomonadota bacterium]